LLTQTDPNWTSGNVHWVVPRSVHTFFTGRGQLLHHIETTLQRCLEDTENPQQCRFVITGIGGQGKSEICLKVANDMRQHFWGVFWVDVSSTTVAENTFRDIAKRVHASAAAFEEARQALANITRPWLLILDNADDPNIDYQHYFPTGNLGVVLMTSRNPQCSRYATIEHLSLEGLDDDAARSLLFQAAEIPDPGGSQETDALRVSQTLGFHPLALIQAGSYVARGHCTLAEYIDVYQRHRQRLLQFRPQQAQSRYGHVYATFEASADVLKTSRNETAQDSLDLLSVLSMLSSSTLPLSIFEAAWEGASKISADPDDDDIDNLSKWHVSQLMPLIQPDLNMWDSFRIMEAVGLLGSLSLVFVDKLNGSISMHPLTHSWARDRQDRTQQDKSWISAGSTIILSNMGSRLWQTYERQLRPHLHSYLDRPIAQMFSCGPKLMVCRIITRCGWLLHRMRDDKRLYTMMSELFVHLSIDPRRPGEHWMSLYDLTGRNLGNMGKIKEAVQLLEHVVQIQERSLAEDHPDRLLSQHELAVAYHGNGQVKEAVQLLEHVVQIKERSLTEDHPDRLASQHRLAWAYQDNGQVKEAVQLLEHVVQIKERSLAEDHPDRLASQHTLAWAYQDNGQVKEAVQLLEHVVQIKEQSLTEDHPSRLASQHELARAYQANGQVKEAVQLLEHVVQIRERSLAEDHPDRLSSQQTLAWAYRANGQVKEAMQLLEHVVQIGERSLAEDHPSRLASQYKLAGAYQANGQVKEAVQLLEHVVQIRERSLAEDHPDRLSSQHELARAYRANGQVKEAVQLLEHVVQIRERSLAEDHPSRLASQHTLARAYRVNGQVKEAVQLLEHVVQISERSLAEDHPDRLSSQHELARAYQANGQVKEAVQRLGT